MNLENLNVQEMNNQELITTDGGFFGLDDLVIGLTVAAFTVVVSDWENFKAGFNGAPPVN